MTIRNFYFPLFIILLSLIFIQCKEDKQSSVPTTGVASIDGLTKAINDTPMDASLYYERSKAYIQNDGYEYAISDLQKALQLDSLNPDYYHLLSDAYMDYFRSKQALQTMEKVAEMYPKRVPTLLKLTETQVILQQYDNAITTLDNILKVDPLNAEAFYMLGLIFYEQKDYPKATNALLTSVENDPELIDGWLMLGEIASASDDPKAKRYYENALTAQPESVTALHSLAFYLQNHDDVAEAQKLYKKIHVLDRSYFQANLNSGILYIEQDSIDKAFEQFDIIVLNHPSNYLGYYYRGVAHELKGDIQAALSDYENSVRINPDFEKAVKAVAAIKEASK